MAKAASPRFDFGGNYVGDNEDMRGSYIHQVDEGGKLGEAPLEGTDAAGYALYLKGHIVKTFNVAGELEGIAASIYMSQNAFVKEINILTGAAVRGDIISHGEAESPLLHKEAPANLYSSLIFGRKRSRADLPELPIPAST
ncbi:MAG: hypothetical protein K6C33_07200 [Desulfovibrio sp.]|nr:hypothetical protein [Desulfovibrio sp.]MCR5170230.1 hypothetical protein [Desulfovibrio sp.]